MIVPTLSLALISGVLAELNNHNPPASCSQSSSSQSSSSTVSPRQSLLQVSGTQSSRSGEEDSGTNDEATDTGTSVVPDSRPPTPPSNQQATAGGHAHTPSLPNSTKKLEPLQTRLRFESKRAYNDFRVCHLHFKLTLDLAAYPHG